MSEYKVLGYLKTQTKLALQENNFAKYTVPCFPPPTLALETHTWGQGSVGLAYQAPSNADKQRISQLTPNARLEALWHGPKRKLVALACNNI